MFVVIVEFTLEAEYIERFRERVRRQAGDSLNRELDCHVFDVCIDPARDDFVMLYEVYSDRGAFDAHLLSSHFVDFDETVRGWIIDKKVVFLERF